MSPLYHFSLFLSLTSMFPSSLSLSSLTSVPPLISHLPLWRQHLILSLSLSVISCFSASLYNLSLTLISPFSASLPPSVSLSHTSLASVPPIIYCSLSSLPSVPPSLSLSLSRSIYLPTYLSIYLSSIYLSRSNVSPPLFPIYLSAPNASSPLSMAPPLPLPFHFLHALLFLSFCHPYLSSLSLSCCVFIYLSMFVSVSNHPSIHMFFVYVPLSLTFYMFLSLSSTLLSLLPISYICFSLSLPLYLSHRILTHVSPSLSPSSFSFSFYFSSLSISFLPVYLPLFDILHILHSFSLSLSFLQCIPFFLFLLLIYLSS